MNKSDRLTDNILRALNGQPDNTPIPPKPTDLPEHTVSVPVVAPSVLFIARETAAALDNIASGWPELTHNGYHDYLTDGANLLRELADAVQAQQAVI